MVATLPHHNFRCIFFSFAAVQKMYFSEIALRSEDVAMGLVQERAYNIQLAILA
jgi:hypothetical protein